jgi:hypothetical protein
MKTQPSSADATDLFEGYDLVNIFKFCPLQDVLSFGATSKRAIPDVAVELDRRRRRRMMCCTRWEHAPNGTGARFIGVGGKEADWSARTYRFFSLGPKCPANSDDDVLPSMADRLGVLLRSRPFVATHPLYNRVRELYDLLNEDTGGDDGVMAGDNTENEGVMKEAEPSGDEVPFENLLLKLRFASRAHRLHAEILLNAIEPPLANDEVNVTYVKVTLERYIGDVLVASAFISHSVSGLVEGGPSEENWMDATLKRVKIEDTNPYNWYQAWIFLHSTVLRTAPFLPEHAKLLGIESRKPVLGIDDELGFPRAELVEDGLGLPPLIPPLPPFVGAGKRLMMSQMSHLNDMPMKITKNTFGGLGPAFRGRDNVSSETIWPMRAISVITAFTGLAAAHYQSPTNPAALRWREGTEPGIR